MPNEEYLYLVYFGSLGLSAVVGIFVYLFLRGPLKNLTKETGKFGLLFRKGFAPGALLPPIFGFLVVSMMAKGCSKLETFEAVVEDREHMTSKGYEYVDTIFGYSVKSLYVWLFLVIALLVFIRKITRNRA